MNRKQFQPALLHQRPGQSPPGGQWRWGGALADTYRATLAEMLNQPGRLGADPAGRAKKGEAAMSTIPIAPTILITIGILLGLALGLALTLATAIL